MTGIGTLVNVLAIICGGIIGMTGKRFLQGHVQEALMKTNGLCVIFIGVGGAVSKMLTLSQDGQFSTQGSIMLIISFTVGALIGELLNIEKQFEKFGIWLRKKSGSEGDTGFVNAFLTASFTVCIGAMAIVGAIQEGMQGDPSVLYTKALLDFLIIAVMAAALGKGCLFAAIPVGIWQWSVTALAGFLAPFMTQAALSNISMTGSILIFCVGVNLLVPGKFRVANMLPTLLIAAIFGMLS